MKPKLAKIFLALLVLSCATLYPAPVRGQTTGAVLSGTVSSPAGAVVSSARVSIKNADTGQVTEVQTSPAGAYTAPNLPPGNYEVSAQAEGFGSISAKVTLAAGVKQTVDLALPATGATAEPTLGDLGFTPDQVQGSAQEQARLDRRSHMLRTHQRLGLITTAPLIATLITSAGAGGRHSTSSGRELHAALGGVTAGLYLTTASFAIFAPKIHGTPVRGPIRLHRALAWVHGTGMILTPVLGALAYDQRNRGEKVHGIAKAHAPVAVATGIAYGLAILSVSIKF